MHQSFHGLKLLLLACLLEGCGTALSSDPITALGPHAYLTDSAGQVFECGLSSGTGALSTCTIANTGAPVTSSVTVTFNTLNGTEYAYLTDSGTSGNGNIFRCSVDSTSGGIGLCSVSNGGVLGWRPGGIAFATFNESVSAYVADQLGNVYHCGVDSTTGDLTNCAVNNGGASWDPQKIVFQQTAGINYAYVSDLDGNIFQCTVTLATGALNVCTASNGGIASGTWSPVGFSFQSINGVNYVYIAEDVSTGNVYQCSVNATTGALMNCAISNAGQTDWFPSDVEFFNSSGVLSAYVPDYAGNVYQCSVNTNSGAFSHCVLNNGGATASLFVGMTFRDH